MRIDCRYFLEKIKKKIKKKISGEGGEDQSLIMSDTVCALIVQPAVPGDFLPKYLVRMEVVQSQSSLTVSWGDSVPISSDRNTGGGGGLKLEN